ncbi:hypothetical protein AHiyo8_06740 [Arthrobacter sp. Hiyo8]|jgi:hypothetical protein|nr:hypothetical protein AHiyo8_06740 [Arthrobacter sp. Hiyo8]GAP59639.1 hypothetical protein AHiyo1_29790 [Arthrobacter sp. Hiyo1]
MLPPIKPAGLYGRQPPHHRMPGNPSRTTAFRLAGCARPWKPASAESPGTSAEKETTMIKRHSDVVLEVTAHDPDTIENDLNTAVEIAREHAVKESRHGILVTQHGFTRYTVAISRDVPFGQTLERRELPASPLAKTESGS